MKSLTEFLGLSPVAEQWLPQVFLVVLIVVLVNIVSHFLLSHVQKISRRTTSPWDDALIRAARRPLAIVIWVIGIAFAVSIVSKESDAAIYDSVPHYRNIGIVVCFTWFLVRLIGAIAQNIVAMREKEGVEVDYTSIDALAKLARFAVIIIAILVAMQTVGVSVSGVLAAGGIGGLALAFASKDLLANFFGGLAIYMDRPFSVGDWIRSPDKEIEGTVEAIGWRSTRVRAFNMNPVYVPNALFTTIVVENPSRMTNRRIKETIGIRYEDIALMGAIVTDVKAMLKNHPEIDTTRTLIVNFDTFGPSSLDFFIYTFTKTKEWVHYHEVKQDVLLKVAEIIDQHGAQIAFPTRTLHIEAATSSPQVCP